MGYGVGTDYGPILRKVGGINVENCNSSTKGCRRLSLWDSNRKSKYSCGMVTDGFQKK